MTSKNSAEINWDFSVRRHAETMKEIAYDQGKEEVDKRCENLPYLFKDRLIAYLKGEDVNGREY